MKTAEEKKDDSNLSTPDTNLSLNSLKDNDSKMKLFTGLTYYQFLALFNFLGESVNDLSFHLISQNHIFNFGIQKFFFIYCLNFFVTGFNTFSLCGFFLYGQQAAL
jgi:hypothetical protein